MSSYDVLLDELCVYARTSSLRQRHRRVPDSAIVLDIDGTIATNGVVADNPSQIKTLRKFGHVFVNTARPCRYCTRPKQLTLDYVLKEDHYCFVDGSHTVPESKVENMKKIWNRMRKLYNRDIDPHRIILIDDRYDVVQAVKKHGFEGVHVNETEGITADTVRRVEELLS